MNPLIGEGLWTVEAAIEETVAADVITAALFTRFRSRQDHTFCEKMLSAMRFGFGGHVEGQEPVDPEPLASMRRKHVNCASIAFLHVTDDALAGAATRRAHEALMRKRARARDRTAPGSGRSRGPVSTGRGISSLWGVQFSPLGGLAISRFLDQRLRFSAVDHDA